MKTKNIFLKIFFLILFSTAKIAAQTITIDGNVTYFVPTTLSLIGNDGANPFRNIYAGTVSGIPCCGGSGNIKVSWNSTANRWEVLMDYISAGGFVPCLISGVDTYPNPPDLSIGSYVDSCGAGIPVVFNGSGTQATLLKNDDFNSFKNKFIISPNPTKNILNVASIEAIKSLELFDLNSRMIIKNENFESINIEKLNSGLYLMKITTENGFSTQRIIKE